MSWLVCSVFWVWHGVNGCNCGSGTQSNEPFDNTNVVHGSGNVTRTMSCTSLDPHALAAQHVDASTSRETNPLTNGTNSVANSLDLV
jgi:hypothetical protein